MNLFIFSGDLKSWAVVLHGIAEDPNRNPQVIPTLQGKGNLKSSSLDNENVKLEFDGSENKVVVEPSHVHNPHLAASQPEVADMSSVTSSGTPCLKDSMSTRCLGWCIFVIFLQLTIPTVLWPSMKNADSLVCNRVSLSERPVGVVSYNPSLSSSYFSINPLQNNQNNVNVSNPSQNRTQIFPSYS